MNILIIAIVCCAFVADVTARDFPPTITSPQGNKWSQPVRYVRVTNTAFECKATGKPIPKYYWTFNGKRVIPDINVVHFDEDTGTLTTGPNFGQQHSGDYQCYAYNDQGTSMTPILKILKAYDEAFRGTEDVTNTQVYRSKYVKLECRDVPDSVPWWTFKWTKGTSTDKDSFGNLVLDNRMIIDDKGSLHILWSEMSDDGYYACATTNDVILSTYRSTHVIKLSVLAGADDDRGPEFMYSQDVQVYAGKDVELLCIFSYYSRIRAQMQINWLHGGEKVGKGPNITLHNVQLPDASQDQSGEYLCLANLGEKQAMGRVNLKIVSPPTFIPGQTLDTKSVPVEKDAVFRCGTSSYQTYSYPPVWFVNGKPLIGCPERFFECMQTTVDGYSQCISEKNSAGESVVCNNDPSDCSDGSDESTCFVITCPESQKQCRDQCIPEGDPCEDLTCSFPDFLCYDEMACVTSQKICNGVSDCKDGSDEIACPGGNAIQRNRFFINSQRTELTLPSVSLTDSMCFQCMVRNEYGTTIGDACLTVIDKIVILKGPNSTYDVEPDTRIEIIMEARTDVNWQNQMNYTWQRYEEVTDKKTGEKYTVAVTLPPKGSRANQFYRVTQEGRNLTIVFPPVKVDDDKTIDLYNELIDREYTVIVQHRFDRVELNFTVNGKEIVKPVPVVETASTNLWFIALIIGILLLFIVVLLIICYLHRNRGGTYLLGKKEHQAGHDPEKELKDGFHDVGRIDDDEDNPPGDKVSLSESVKPYESDDDPTEEYGGDFDVSKFNEEGSFIGAYGERRGNAKEATV